MTDKTARRRMHWFTTILMLFAVAPIFAAEPAKKAAEKIKPALDKDLKLVIAPPADWSAPTVEMATFKPTAKEVLTPPEGLEGAYKPAKTPPVIDWAVLPGQWRGGALWSNWGDSLLASDGNFYCSLGDHHGPYGNSFIYRVNPKTKAVDLVVDFTKALGTAYDKDKELYAPGKIHGPLVEADGWIYFAGYRGAIKYTTRKEEYHGDHFMRYNIATGQVEDLGIPVADCSFPIYRIHEPTMRLYGLTQPSAEIAKTVKPQLFVYDLSARKMVFCGGPEPTMARGFIITDDGRAYYSHRLPPTAQQQAEHDKQVAELQKTLKGKPLQNAIKKLGKPQGEAILVKYDPKANEVVETKMVVPDDGTLRAASRVASNGVAYCVTHSGLIFSVDTNKHTVKEYCPVVPEGRNGYTAVVQLDPTERFVYLVPGSHGHANTSGSVVVSFEIKTGKLKALCFLNEFLRDKERYNLGGSFGTALSADGAMLHICWNGRAFDKQVSRGSEYSIGFDECSVMTVHIPAGER